MPWADPGQGTGDGRRPEKKPGPGAFPEPGPHQLERADWGLCPAGLRPVFPPGSARAVQGCGEGKKPQRNRPESAFPWEKPPGAVDPHSGQGPSWASTGRPLSFLPPPTNKPRCPRNASSRGNLGRDPAFGAPSLCTSTPLTPGSTAPHGDPLALQLPARVGAAHCPVLALGSVGPETPQCLRGLPFPGQQSRPAPCRVPASRLAVRMTLGKHALWAESPGRLGPAAPRPLPLVF